MIGIGGISTLVLVMVLSFAIDGVVKAIVFLLSFIDKWVTWFPDPPTLRDAAAELKARRKQQLLYYGLAGVLGLVVVAFVGNVRVLRALGYEEANALLDAIATGVVLIAGSDLIGKVLQISGLTGGPKPAAQPLEVTGRLVLETPRPPQAGALDVPQHHGV